MNKAKIEIKESISVLEHPSKYFDEDEDLNSTQRDVVVGLQAMNSQQYQKEQLYNRSEVLNLGILPENLKVLQKELCSNGHAMTLKQEDPNSNNL